MYNKMVKPDKHFQSQGNVKPNLTENVDKEGEGRLSSAGRAASVSLLHKKVISLRLVSEIIEVIYLFMIYDL